MAGLIEKERAMSSLHIGLIGIVVLVFPILSDDASRQGQADKNKKSPLALSIAVDKKVFQPQDAVNVVFHIRNVSDKPVFIGDGYLGPK
jgi:hypothetical protein